MMILDFASDAKEFFSPLLDLMKDLWSNINGFLLQYMPQNVASILIYGILIAIALIIVLAIMNKNN